MKQYKKKTLALVLASVVTVVGAFGAENYKNSLMSLNFEQGQDKTVRLNLLTKSQFDGNLDITKTDAYTYVITLADTNNEVPPEYNLGDKVESVNIKTFPYTTEQNGYTRIIVKTYDNIPLFPKTGLFLPSGSGNEIDSPPPELVSAKESSVSANIPAAAPVSAQYNTPASDVDIKESVKQFQPSTTPDIKPTAAGQTAKNSDLTEETPNRMQELISWTLGIALFIFLVIFFFLKAKEKIAEVTGEQGNYNLDDEPKKNEKKTRKTSINTTISRLDRRYEKPVKMPAPVQNVQQEADDETEQEVENNIVDLDELLQEKNKSEKETLEDTKSTGEVDEGDNASLEEFLSAYDFSDEDGNNAQEITAQMPEAQETEDKKFDNESYEKCINNKNLKFTKDDIEKIDKLLNSEINDETRREAPDILVSSKKNKKLSPMDLLENFVTLFAVQQNISFSKDDVDALLKIINVELDNSFINDLKTNPGRMEEMQAEIENRKSKPHKTSELLTLNVKDMLPNLSEALKKQGGRRIESEVKPEVVYYSEGYDVSTLKLNDTLPDLSKEIDNDDAYKVRPSDEIEYADNSYDVQKMSITDELPDLEDVMKNPEKYDTPEPEPEEVDEEALLRNISNVTFKPFDDGSRSFEIINEFDDSNAPSVSDIQEEIKQIGDNFEIISEEEIPAAQENDNDDFESLYNNDYVDLDKEPDSLDATELREDDIPPMPLEDNPESLEANWNLDDKAPQLPLEDKSENDAEKLMDLINDIEDRKETKQTAAEPVIEKDKKTEQEQEKDKNNQTLPPEFCVLEGERFSIISNVNFTEKMGCYLAKNEHGYCIIGFVGDRTFKIKNYEKLNTEKLQSRMSEKLDNDISRYLVRIGIHKFILNVKKDDMEFVMDLC